MTGELADKAGTVGKSADAHDRDNIARMVGLNSELQEAVMNNDDRTHEREESAADSAADRAADSAADMVAATAVNNTEEGSSEEDKMTPYDLIKDIWVDDHEVQIYKEVMRRAKNPDGYPDRDDLGAMEEPLHRLLGAVVLFDDLTVDRSGDRTPRRVGLAFLANAMDREIMRLHRLFHGTPPRDMD